MAKQDTRPVNYASREDLEEAILMKYPLLFSAPPIQEELPDEESPKNSGRKRKHREAKG